MEKPASAPLWVDRNGPPPRIVQRIWSNGILGLLLGLVAMLGVVVTPLGVIGYFVPCLLLLLFFLMFPAWRMTLPVSFNRVLQVLIVVSFGLDIFLTGGILDALVRLNILLVTYRCITPRTRREDLQLVLVGLFLIIITGVFSVSALFFPQIILFSSLSMVFLLNVNQLDSASVEGGGEEYWEEFRWRTYVSSWSERWDKTSLVLGGGSFLFLFLLATGIFLTIPRLDLENRFEFMQIRGVQAQSGFSEEVSLSDITNILQSTQPALRVDVPEGVSLPGQIYWRMLAFDEYAGGNFRLSNSLAYEQSSWQGRVVTPGALNWERFDALVEDDLRWTFYLEPGVSRYLPMGGPFEEIRFQEEQNLRQLRAMRLLAQTFVNSSVFIYQVRGMNVLSDRFPDPEFARRLAGEKDSGRYPQTTLELPVNEESRAYLREVVESLQGDGDLSPLAFANRASTYLQERHGYSLETSVPPGGRDIVVRWMDSGAPAHCEYFAAALVLLAREAGIPARMVVGFAGGRQNAFEGHIMVRFSEAHAWVEVFDDGFWHRLDPTPAVDGTLDDAEGDGEDDDGFFLQDTGLAAFMDGLRMLWYRRIVSFDESEQSDFFARVRQNLESLGTTIRDRANALVVGVNQWIRGPWDGKRLWWTGLILGTGVLSILLWIRYGWRWRFLLPAPVRARWAIHPLRRQAGYYLRWYHRRLEKGARPADEWREAFHRVEQNLLAMRYGPRSRWVSHPDQFFRTTRKLLRKL